MWLIAGLGNPGGDYAATRHNIGFVAVDALADACGVKSFSSKFHGEVAQASFGDGKLLLLKPQTFMNRSGTAVQAAMAFYKIPLEKLVVIHDELDLPAGKLRIKKGGGANGHNGLKDIDACVGEDYWRMRLGIGHPGSKDDVHDYVLGHFSKDDRVASEKLIVALIKYFALFWQHSPEALMSKVAEELAPPRPKKEKEKENENDGI